MDSHEPHAGWPSAASGTVAETVSTPTTSLIRGKPVLQSVDSISESATCCKGNLRPVATICAFAKSSDDPQTVYSAASTPGPTPAPGRPSNFRTELLEDGALRISFDCDNPSRVQGVTYKVERQDEPQGPLAFVTNAKGREFTDAGIPAGSAVIYYRVTAQTSTRDGDAGGVTIRYGANNQAVVSTEDTTGGLQAG